MRVVRVVVAAAVVAGVVSGCGGSDDVVSEAASAEASVAVFDPVDVTDDVVAAAGDLGSVITGATVVEEGRIEVATSIVDPREDGSQEAANAVAVCEAAVSVMPDAVYVTVMEDDGTAFAVYSTGPLPMDLPSNECVEY